MAVVYAIRWSQRGDHAIIEGDDLFILHRRTDMRLCSGELPALRAAQADMQISSVRVLVCKSLAAQIACSWVAVPQFSLVAIISDPYVTMIITACCDLSMANGRVFHALNHLIFVWHITALHHDTIITGVFERTAMGHDLFGLFRIETTIFFWIILPADQVIASAFFIRFCQTFLAMIAPAIIMRYLGTWITLLIQPVFVVSCPGTPGFKSMPVEAKAILIIFFFRIARHKAICAKTIQVYIVSLWLFQAISFHQRAVLCIKFILDDLPVLCIAEFLVTVDAVDVIAEPVMVIGIEAKQIIAVFQ